MNFELNACPIPDFPPDGTAAYYIVLRYKLSQNINRNSCFAKHWALVRDTTWAQVATLDHVWIGARNATLKRVKARKDCWVQNGLDPVHIVGPHG